MTTLMRLRTLAEAATPGERRIAHFPDRVEVRCVDTLGEWVLFALSSARDDIADAMYIVALDPATVLALVEAAEAAEAVIATSPTEEGICHYCAEPIYLGREVES